MTYLIIILVVWNIVTFSLYGIDKYRAINSQYRISEHTLIAVAILSGGIGALVGSQVWQHKTKKILFQVILPIAAVFTAFIFYLLATK